MSHEDAGYQWLDRPADVHALAESLPGDLPLYIDTEFMRERTFWPRLALVQVNTGEEIMLVDPVALPDGEPLRQLLSGRLLYLHGCSEDMEALHRATGDMPARVLDTQIAAALTGEDLQCGYQRLVEQILGITLDKEAQRSDWLRRPLSGKQLHYAAQDVEHLPELVAVLSERLARLGRTAWWQEECQRLLEDVRRQPAPEDAWRKVKGAAGLPPHTLGVLQALAAWRDSAARERDLPRGFVIRDNDLLTLAREQPASAADLGRLGLHAAQVRRDGERILALVEQGRASEPPRPLPGPPSAEQRQLVKRLRQRVAQCARELSVEPEVLMRRRWLEALVRDPQRIPAALSGWRRPVVTEPVLELLS